MTREDSAIHFTPASRIHISLDVNDLDRSLAFYRLLLGAEPTKVRPGYAKFEPELPPVNLSLVEGKGAGDRRERRPGDVLHYGIQVQSSDAVRAAAERFQAAGLQVRIEESTSCCHAVQTKVWVEDPDGNPWEVFVVLEADAPELAPANSTCCADSCCKS